MPRPWGRPGDDRQLPDDLARVLEAVRLRPLEATRLAGDASERRFYRVRLADGTSVVAALYPEEHGVVAARHDAEVQRWSLQRRLPVAELVTASDRVVVSQDLGEEDLERALRRGDVAILERAVASLGRFQRTDWRNCPNPPFDTAFFRHELAGFEEHYLTALGSFGAPVPTFLDRLAGRLADHPYRLVHRDFHVNNLLLHQERVWAVDFQDMRGGPDTYDLVSLLRERAATDLADRACHESAAARSFGWPAGWQQRLQECAAQRGLKVLGTFARLAGEGRQGYGRWIPGVRVLLVPVLEELDAPMELRRALGGSHPAEGL